MKFSIYWNRRVVIMYTTDSSKAVVGVLVGESSLCGIVAFCCGAAFMICTVRCVSGSLCLVDHCDHR